MRIDIRDCIEKPLQQLLILVFLMAFAPIAWGQTSEVHDIPTRSGVMQRVLWVKAADPKGVMIVLPGGHGGMQITPSGRIGWGETIFFVRNRETLARQDVHVLLLDAPSDKQAPPFLSGHRQRTDHFSDLRAIMRWIRSQTDLPIWMVGFSRGTQSVAYYAYRVGDGPDAPDAIVLASSIVADGPTGRPVSEMPLERIAIPVLWVHHEGDACKYCPFAKVQSSMAKMLNAAQVDLLSYTVGVDHRDVCGPLGYHGFRQIESQVERDVLGWLTTHAPKRGP